LHSLLKKKIKKIGILGGTFDPPHEGHLAISKIVIKKLGLNKLIWVVTKKNPFKKIPYLDKNKRIELSKKLTKNHKKIYIQYLDEKVRSTSTFRLLKYMKKKNKNCKLYFLIGSDNLIKFNKWYNWEKITGLAKMVVFPRKNYPKKLPSFILRKKQNKKYWIFIKAKQINISSSLIRKYW
tara:strand:+ start:1039 stop:1578 length:540 start_codon:yes stop_codon:yes gene_type:complete